MKDVCELKLTDYSNCLIGRRNEKQNDSVVTVTFDFVTGKIGEKGS